MVQLVNINVVGFQSAQARLDRSDDVGGRKVLLRNRAAEPAVNLPRLQAQPSNERLREWFEAIDKPLLRWQSVAKLCRDDHAVTLVVKRLADQPFALALCIHVRGIEEGDPFVIGTPKQVD